MPTYRNDTAARITWGGSWIDPGETKVSSYHWPYTELGLTLVSAAPLVATPVKQSQRVRLAAPSAATPASAVLTVATGKTLTFTAGLVDHPSFAAGNSALAKQGEGLAVQIEGNSEDTLSVSNPVGTNVILVKLASTTASKNTALLIQAAVRDLGAVAGVSVADMTVAGDEAYNTAPAIGADIGTAVSATLDNAIDGTTVSTIAFNSFGKANLSIVVLTGEVEAKLGDSTAGIPLSTSVDYQGVHRYRKVNAVTLTSIAPAEVLVVVEEVE